MKARTLLVLAALTVASGCAALVETAANSAGVQSPSKAVADKEPPDILVAWDGTTCRVPEVRFEHIRIGQRITCVWTGQGNTGVREGGEGGDRPDRPGR